MQVKAFALMDTKSGVFHTPFFLVHVGQAVRAVIDLAMDMNTTVGRHPGDFHLYELGAFDDQTGIFEHAIPRGLGSAASFIADRAPQLAQGGLFQAQQPAPNGEYVAREGGM